MSADPLNRQRLLLSDAEWFAVQHAFTDRRFCLQADPTTTEKDLAVLDSAMRKLTEASGRG